jgi:hypothetical protein
MARFSKQEARELGIGHGYEMAIKSGSVNPGCDGWDGMLINADPVVVLEKFGWSGVDTTDRAKELLASYCEGCDLGARIAVEQIESESQE